MNPGAVSDQAVARLVVHLVEDTAGVVRLQPQLIRRFGPRDELSLVSIDRGADGALRIELRLVLRLDPAPKATLSALSRRLHEDVAALTGRPISVGLAVVAVE